MATCMPWFKVHAGWSSHPKVGRLCDVLENDLADAYVCRIWDYCAERQGDGHFPMPGASGAVERAARWTGARGVLADALVSVGLLDKAEDGSMTVHDWADEQKAVAEKFNRDRERRRAEREEGRGRVARPARDSLSTLYSQVSTSTTSVASTSPSAENNGGAGGSRDVRAPSARPSTRTVQQVAERPPVNTASDAEPFAPLPAPGGESLPDGWCRLFREARGHEYLWRVGSDDAKARELLALAGPGGVAEILRRARNGLQATYGQRVSTPAELVRKWDANATPEPTGKPKPPAQSGDRPRLGNDSKPAPTGDRPRL